MQWMITSIPGLNLLLISSWMEVWFVKVVARYLNFSTLSKHVLPVFMLWFCPSGWSWDTTIYFVFSAFTLDHCAYYWLEKLLYFSLCKVHWSNLLVTTKTFLFFQFLHNTNSSSTHILSKKQIHILYLQSYTTVKTFI